MKKTSPQKRSRHDIVTKAYLDRALDGRMKPVLKGITIILEELHHMREENSQLRQMREQLYSNDTVLERRVDHLDERIQVLEIAK